MSRRRLWAAAILASGMVLLASVSVAQTPADAKPAAAYNTIPLTRFAATIAAVFNIDSPKQAEPPLEWVCEKIRKLSLGPIDRVVIYNPDAVAQWLVRKHRDVFKPVFEHAPIELPMTTMMPSVTPVCFGTMYTGARPEVHGIQVYAKPVIKIDTLFDSLLRAEKRAVIVATEGSSMSKIFLERKMDYFIFADAHAALNKAHELIEHDKHDFIVVYNGAYDSTMHRTGTESKAFLESLRFQVEGFDALAKCVKRRWARHNTLLAFSTDHGVHDLQGSKGTIGKHGTNVAEDINILHCLGVMPQSQPPSRQR
jgi:hypothetical protein